MIDHIDDENDTETEQPKRAANAQHRTKRVIAPSQLVADSPRSAALSEWTNPSKNDVAFELFIDGPTRRPDGRMDPATWCLVRVPAGGKVMLPLWCDGAIHTLDRDGMVCGGLAPQLRKVGAPEPKFMAGVGGS